jgi:hypothetical protein
MARFAYLPVLLGLLSGCVPIASDPARDQFGVSTARPDAGMAAPSAEQMATLDWKSNQFCTRGYEAGATAILPAEATQQLVDQKLRCNHYDRIDFDFIHMDWSNLL